MVSTVVIIILAFYHCAQKKPAKSFKGSMSLPFIGSLHVQALKFTGNNYSRNAMHMEIPSNGTCSVIIFCFFVSCLDDIISFNCT